MAADRIALLMPRDDDRRIVERSWGIEWSRSGVAFWRRCEIVGPAPVPVTRTIAARPAGGRGWVAAGVVALGSVGLTAAGVTAGPVLPRPERQALVSVDVPPAQPFRESAPRPAAESRRAAAIAAPVTAPVEEAAPPAVEDRQAAIVEIGEEGATETSFSRRTDALAAALSTGRLQSWTEPDAGVRGFVVVGDTVAEADQTCREVSILLKSGEGNTVERFRRCVGASAAG